MRTWIDKQRHILDFTLSSLGRRAGKNLALLLVYTALVFILASLMFLTHALKREAALALKNAPDMVVQRMTAGRHDLIPDGYRARVAGIRGVSAVRGRLWGYYFDPVVSANYTLMVPGEFPHPAGSIVIGDTDTDVIRRVAPDGIVTTIAGKDASTCAPKRRRRISPSATTASGAGAASWPSIARSSGELIGFAGTLRSRRG